MTQTPTKKLEKLNHSNKLFDEISASEGFRAEPYLDDAGIPTIGKGTTFGISNKLKIKRPIQILSLFGIWIPFVISIYYVYIESWTLGYSIKSLLGDLQSNLSNPTNQMNFYGEIFKNYIVYIKSFSLFYISCL